MTKYLIFDLGGVLIDLDMPRMIQKLCGLGVQCEKFFSKDNNERTSTICEGLSISGALADYQIGALSTEALCAGIQHYCTPGTTIEQIKEAWNSCLLQIPRERLELIKSLREKGYRTYMLSNTNDLHWQYIEHKYLAEDGLKCKDLFDGLFLSHEVKMAKPEPDIYEHLLKTIGCKGEECLFIDDTKANIEAAMRMGINAEWLDLTKEDVIQLFERIEI